MSEDVKVSMMVAVRYRNAWWPAMVTRVWDRKTVNLVVFSDWGTEALTSVLYLSGEEAAGLAGPMWAFLFEVDETEQQGWVV